MDWTGGIEIGASELLSSDCPMGGANPWPELDGNNLIYSIVAIIKVTFQLRGFNNKIPI